MATKQIINFTDLQNVTQSYNIKISDKQLDLFKKYYDFLLEWNKKINLISRRETNIIEKHFLDSILFLPEIETLTAYRLPLTTVFDIGSGGGFPAIPLAIMKPNWQFTLCESVKKKTFFLNELIKHLGLKNVEIINRRVETLHAAREASEPRRRQATSLQRKFDLVTARAVDKLNVLIKYSLPLLKQGGYLLAFKSRAIEEEIKDAKIPAYAGMTLNVFSKEINGVERKLIVLQN